MWSIAAELITGVVLLISAIWDIRFRKIPNAVTFSGTAIGLTLAFLTDWKAGVVAVAAIAFIFLVGMTGIMGGGDLKLIMALVALQGVSSALWAVGIASVVILLVELCRHPPTALRAVKQGMKAMLGMDRVDPQGKRVPFAPFLLIGYYVYLVIMIRI